MLLDDILSRLVKLEGKVESVVNTTSTNSSQHPARGAIASGPAALVAAKREAPGGLLGTSRLQQPVPVGPL